MNVLIAIRSLVRTFEVGDGAQDRGIQNYSLQGKARLEILEGSRHGPSFDDESGPSYQAKRHAVDARIATSVTFVPESSWAEKIEYFLNMHILHKSETQEQDRKAMAAAAAYAWYVPMNEEVVRDYGGPKYDELECYLKIGDELVPDLQAWLDRAAFVTTLLPAITLHELYFHSDEPIITGMAKPGPRWEDFIKMRRPGTFESYSVSFRSLRPRVQQPRRASHMFP